MLVNIIGVFGHVGLRLRPIRELKGYQKVYLEPEEEKFVTLYLSKDAFSYYDVNRKNFVVDNGEYNIELGFSSRDIKLKDQTQINVVSAIDEEIGRASCRERV